MIGEVWIVADHDLAAVQVFSLKLSAIGREDELRLGPRRRRAGPQRGQGLGDRAGGTSLDMDIAGLKHAADVGLVRRAGAQALDGGGLVAKRFQEGEGELTSVERCLCQRGDRLFDLNSVHQRSPSGTGRSPSLSWSVIGAGMGSRTGRSSSTPPKGATRARIAAARF